MSAPDIRRPEAVDADWLTRALQSAGVDAVVAGFEAKAVGTGQIGDSVRFRLRYARGGDEAPASLVGKFPSADKDSFGTGVALGNYIREVKFYRHLADTALVSTPRWYMAEVEEATSEFVLLMEDLAPAEPGDQLRGVNRPPSCTPRTGRILRSTSCRGSPTRPPRRRARRHPAPWACFGRGSASATATGWSLRRWRWGSG